MLPRRLAISCFKRLIYRRPSNFLKICQEVSGKRFVHLSAVLKQQEESLVTFRKELTPEEQCEEEDDEVSVTSACSKVSSWVWEEGQPLVVHSPIADIEIPPAHFSHTVWSSVWSSHTSCYRAALVNGESGRTYSYKECERLSKNFASSLIKFGAEPGDVLALILPNTPEFVFVFTGGPLAGVIVTTISPNFTHFEITQQLRNSGATWVVTDLDRYETVNMAITNLENENRQVDTESSLDDYQAVRTEALKLVLTCDSEQADLPTGVISLALMLADDGTKCPDNPDFDYHEDVVVIPYSSGTTGPPKVCGMRRDLTTDCLCAGRSVDSPEHGVQHVPDLLPADGSHQDGHQGREGGDAVCVAHVPRLRYERDHDQRDDGGGEDGDLVKFQSAHFPQRSDHLQAHLPPPGPALAGVPHHPPGSEAPPPRVTPLHPGWSCSGPAKSDQRVQGESSPRGAERRLGDVRALPGRQLLSGGSVSGGELRQGDPQHQDEGHQCGDRGGPGARAAGGAAGAGTAGDEGIPREQGGHR